jgi:NADH dehydrogenase
VGEEAKSDPRVVIVGGGFAGLNAARGLAGVPVRVTLVDKHNYHLFRPMMYQVASGLLSADEISAPLRSVLSRQRNVEVLMAEVVGVDTERGRVRLSGFDLPYDYLVLATGIQYNYFGHDEWKALAPGLDSLDDADRIRGKILLAFEEAERLAATGAADRTTVEELLTFVLVGAGTVGVEMAGTLAEMTRMALDHDFRHIDPRSARILLYEAGPRVLPTYPEKLSSSARRHLERLGVTIHTGVPVDSVTGEGIVVAGKLVRSRTVLWCAGVLASPAARWLEAPMDRSGRLRVEPDLSVPDHPNVFAVGDTALVVAHTRNLFGLAGPAPRPMPGVAPAAIQEGEYIADLIRRRVTGRPPPSPFWYWDKGDLAVVGRTFAVADLRVLRLSGLLAWVLWAAVHIYFLIGFASRLFVMAQWAVAFITGRRAVRIFPEQNAPDDARAIVKGHQ